MKRMAGSYRIAKCQAGMYRLNYFNAPRKSLNSLKLLSLGVTQGIIDEATETTDCYTLRVTVDKEER
jgi:hypothetical protein